MNKPTKYTEELLHFLENEENYPEMIEWIEDLPELDQPDVLREMEAIFKDRHLKNRRTGLARQSQLYCGWYWRF